MDTSTSGKGAGILSLEGLLKYSSLDKLVRVHAPLLASEGKLFEEVGCVYNPPGGTFVGTHLVMEVGAFPFPLSPWRVGKRPLLD